MLSSVDTEAGTTPSEQIVDISFPSYQRGFILLVSSKIVLVKYLSSCTPQKSFNCQSSNPQIPIDCFYQALLQSSIKMMFALPQ